MSASATPSAKRSCRASKATSPSCCTRSRPAGWRSVRPAAVAAPCRDRHRRRARLSRHAGKRRARSGRSKRPSRSRASPSSTPAPRVRTSGLVAKGGRVLAVTAVAETFANARARAYRAVDQIDFADGFHRQDIGWRELERRRSDGRPMNLLWDLYWPVIVAAAVAGVMAGRIRLSTQEARSLLAVGRHCWRSVLARPGSGTAPSAPGTASPRRSNSQTREVLVDWEMTAGAAPWLERPRSAERSSSPDRRTISSAASSFGSSTTSRASATSAGRIAELLSRCPLLARGGTCGAYQLWPRAAAGLSARASAPLECAVELVMNLGDNLWLIIIAIVVIAITGVPAAAAASDACS